MGTRVYVGNLPIDIKEREIDDIFYKYGRIRDIDLKTPSRPPAFAFVVFDDYRDAEDAIRGRDGYMFDGCRLRVEMAKADRGGPRDARGRDDRGGRDAPRASGKTGGRRTEFGVIVSGLPKSCSWQDLKDFMRKAGDVVYTDVDQRGDGVVEFSNREDMERAVDKLDDTEFKNPYDTTFIRVKFANKKGSGSRDRGRDSGRRGDSRSMSKSRSRSRSRERKEDRRGAERKRSPSAEDSGDERAARSKREEDERPRKRSDSDPPAAARGDEDD